MKKISNVTMVACAFGAFVLAGGTGFAISSAFAETDRSTDAVHSIPLPELAAWKANSRGQTYGPLPYDPANEKSPDLVAVSLEDGSEAYVRSADLLPLIVAPEFTSPEEAAAWSRANEAADKARGSTVHPLKVYDAEGRPTGQVWNGVNSDG